MTNLLELAERCEKASGPDRELDAAIYEAVIGQPAPRSQGGQNSLTGRWYAEGETYAGNYTDSLDAALTLVPEGLWFQMDNIDQEPWVRVHTRDVIAPESYGAKTLPLALCAAALRARASTTTGGSDE